VRDVAAAIRTCLVAKTGLAGVFGSRIYAQRSTPPVAYQPSQGAAICLLIRGGQPNYSGALIEPSVQFKVYGASEAVAGAAYNALFDACHDKAGNGIVRWSRSEVLGQPLTEPDSGWPFVLAFFKFWVAA
jgi:hypothetical protein